MGTPGDAVVPPEFLEAPPPLGYDPLIMVWRSLVIAGYAALAVLVGVAHGVRGLVTLGFFYFCAGAWVVFIVAWNWASRRAGEWHGERLAGPR